MEPGAVLIGLVVALIALLIFTVIFQWIWNAVIPDVFGIKQITIWQALGILILASILFGGHRVVNLYSVSPHPIAAARRAETRRRFNHHDKMMTARRRRTLRTNAVENAWTERHTAMRNLIRNPCRSPRSARRRWRLACDL